MVWRLLFCPSRKDREIADQLRALKTLKVTRGGGMSIDPLEIARNEHFIAASKVAKRIVAESNKGL